MSEETFNKAFEEIEAICRKYDMAAHIILSDGTQTRSCYGFDWAKWSRVRQIEKTKVGVPNVFKGRKDAEDFLPTANMLHSIGEAGESLYEACLGLNRTAALRMRNAIQDEARP